MPLRCLYSTLFDSILHELGQYVVWNSDTTARQFAHGARNLFVRGGVEQCVSMSILIPNNNVQPFSSVSK